METVLLLILILVIHHCISHLRCSHCAVAVNHRVFCGDRGNEVNDDLSKAFSRFPSFNLARVS